MKRNPQLEFYLQAEKTLKKNVATKVITEGSIVQERYRYSSTGTVKKEGEMRPEYSTSGVVDEAIKRQHPEDYAIFKAFVDTNQASLYEAARNQVGVPLAVAYFEMPVAIAEEPKEEKTEEVKAEAVQEKPKGLKKFLPKKGK